MRPHPPDRRRPHPHIAKAHFNGPILLRHIRHHLRDSARLLLRHRPRHVRDRAGLGVARVLRVRVYRFRPGHQAAIRSVQLVPLAHLQRRLQQQAQQVAGEGVLVQT